MKEHPHAEVLRAIADGVPLSEFEAKCIIEDEGFNRPLQGWNFDNAVRAPNEWQVRRKPQYIMVNSFKVPKPLDAFESEEYFTPNCEEIDFYCCYRHRGDVEDGLWLARGIVHATKEAAIAHAKAMLGIDPEYFK
jgi:hypothetical protein